jgi:hypothetical protein
LYQQDILHTIQTTPRTRGSSVSSHATPRKNVLSSIYTSSRSRALTLPNVQGDVPSSTPRPNNNEYPQTAPARSTAHFVPRLGGGSTKLSLNHGPVDMLASRIPNHGYVDDSKLGDRPPSLSLDTTCQVPFSIQPPNESPPPHSAISQPLHG